MNVNNDQHSMLLTQRDNSGIYILVVTKNSLAELKACSTKQKSIPEMEV